MMVSLELCKEAALTREKERGSDPFSLRFKFIDLKWIGMVFMISVTGKKMKASERHLP